MSHDPDPQPLSGARHLSQTLHGLLNGVPRTPDEVRDAVYLFTGDSTAKQGRFWLLLLLSGAIATAGVVGDSTATVIGAMIVAPLATPIQGVAVAIAYGEARPLFKSLVILICASLAVIGLAALLGVLLPTIEPIADNSQIASRTSPTIVDLVAATATGLAGAFALARRDLSDILPGVAIAISLVPPLAVVGLTAGTGHWSDAGGAMLLYGTNVMAMIVVGVAVHSGLSHTRERRRDPGFRAGSVYAVVALATVGITAALAIATIRTIQLSDWTNRADQVATTWARSHGEMAVSASFVGATLVVDVEGTGDSGSDRQLLTLLIGQIPPGTPVVIHRVSGTQHRVGSVL